MPKAKGKRTSNRPSVKAMILELLRLGFSKERIATELDYTAYAVRSWAVKDVRPHVTVSKKIEQLLERAKKANQK